MQNLADKKREIFGRINMAENGIGMVPSYVSIAMDEYAEAFHLAKLMEDAQVQQTVIYENHIKSLRQIALKAAVNIYACGEGGIVKLADEIYQWLIKKDDNG